MESSGGQWQLASQNKRKEKARIAARARRSQEANIIMDMASELHITQEKMRRIDKATIVKLAIDYLKAFDILCRSPCSSPASAASSFSASNQQQQQQQRRQQPRLRPRPQEVRSPTIPNENNNIASVRQKQRDEEEQELSSLELPTKIIKIGKEQHHQAQPLQQNKVRQQEISPYSAPILTTSSIFAPKTMENANQHYLMIEKKTSGNSTFVLKPDTEISDEDDLTHLAPQAGDISISLDLAGGCVGGALYDLGEELTLEEKHLRQDQQQRSNLMYFATITTTPATKPITVMPLANSYSTSNNMINVTNNTQQQQAHYAAPPLNPSSWFSTELIFCGNKNQV